ncbi:cuticle protein AMP1A-like [Portunus trituberculatus]|uniref:cuticle protein AMP1A-like n=1 Tax=Portunus trituberculatus TaxID=210409 RepID=UPI001E1D0457|nr:cuticle protein AMP1A-like [Portunus trituberculatus]
MPISVAGISRPLRRYSYKDWHMDLQSSQAPPGNMKFVIIAALAAVAFAAPDRPYSYASVGSSEEAEILQHDFDLQDDGRYNLEVRTSNGISVSQHGSPDGPEGAVVKSGVFSYTAPDGTPVEVKFVADAGGYQPDSDLLPVAPEFPHPIPDFVLAQIAKAAEEDRNRSPEDRYTYA